MSLPLRSDSRVSGQDGGQDSQAAHAARVAEFRDQYVEKLAAPYGWWAIASLDWLEPGENLLGSAPGARLPLPDGAPERVALLELNGAEVVVSPLARGLTLDGKELLEPHVTNGVGVLMVPGSHDGAQPLRVNLLRRGDRFSESGGDRCVPRMRGGTALSFEVNGALRTTGEPNGSRTVRTEDRKRVV